VSAAAALIEVAQGPAAPDAVVTGGTVADVYARVRRRQRR
jgi:hypothetical protein